MKQPTSDLRNYGVKVKGHKMKTLKSILTGFQAVIQIVVTGSSEVLKQANRAELRGSK